MRLSVATTSVPGDLIAKLVTIAEIGFTGIELYEPDLTGFAGTASDVGKRAAALGLAVDIFQPFVDFEGLRGQAKDRALARLDRKLELTQALGTQTLQVGTSADRDAISDLESICADPAGRANEAAA